MSCAELNFEGAEHSGFVWEHSSLCCCLCVGHVEIPQVAWLTWQFSLLELFAGMEGVHGLSLGPYLSEVSVNPFLVSPGPASIAGAHTGVVLLCCPGKGRGSLSSPASLPHGAGAPSALLEWDSRGCADL